MSEITLERFQPHPETPISEIDTEGEQAIYAAAAEMPSTVYGSLPDVMSNRAVAVEFVRDQVVDTLLDADRAGVLQRLKAGEITHGFFTGLPTDQVLPAAPARGTDPFDKLTFISEAIALGIIAAIGEPSFLVGEKDEALVHQIVPVAGKEETQSNAGSVPLQWHQDLAPRSATCQTRRITSLCHTTWHSLGCIRGACYHQHL